jgi:hypothetical protein
MALLMAQALEPESWVLELEQAKQKELEFVKKEQELPVAKKKTHKNNDSCFRQARI